MLGLVVLAGACLDARLPWVGLTARACAQAQPAPAAHPKEADYPRLDDALKSLEREPVLLITEGLEPLLQPAALRAQLAALFGRPVVSLSDPEAGTALATVYCSRADTRGAPRGQRAFVTLRLSMPGLDLWQRIPAHGLRGDPARAIADAVVDMLWGDRMASLSEPELLDPFCPPGLTCVGAGVPRRHLQAARRAPEASLVDPWDTREPRFTLFGSRAYWTRGDPWGAPEANVAAPAAERATDVRPRAQE